VQVGAFRTARTPKRLHDRLSVTYSPIFIQQYDSPDGVFYRVPSAESPAKTPSPVGEQPAPRRFHAFVTRLDEGHPQEQSDERRLFVLQDRREEIPSKIVYEDHDILRSRHQSTGTHAILICPQKHLNR